MEFYVGCDRYEFSYFPFFRVRKYDYYHVYGMRLPSGYIEDVIILDFENPILALKEYSAFLVQNFVIEDDDVLTPNAMKMKKEIIELLTPETKPQ